MATHELRFAGPTVVGVCSSGTHKNNNLNVLKGSNLKVGESHNITATKWLFEDREELL